MVHIMARRGELDEEFPVSFREGAMGMTLSMEPDSRDALVGKVVPHGQAYRAVRKRIRVAKRRKKKHAATAEEEEEEI